MGQLRMAVWNGGGLGRAALGGLVPWVVQCCGRLTSRKQWYGESLYYVGVDLNPGCVRSRSESERIYVEIGSQTNTSFLHSICEKHGPFDIVIDDGGHTTPTINIAIQSIFPHDFCMKQNSIYVIEDMHTMHYSGHVRHPASLYEIVGEAFWSLHHAYVKRANRYDGAKVGGGGRSW